MKGIKIVIPVLFLALVLQCEPAFAAPADQNFDGISDMPIAEKLTFSGIDYLADSGTQVQITDTTVFTATDPSFTGNVIINNGDGVYTPTMFIFSSSNSADNFKLESFYVLASLLNTDTDSCQIDIRGYDGGLSGTEKVRVTGIDLSRSGSSSYDSANLIGSATCINSINNSSDKGGLLTFGADWSNIDTVVITSTDTSKKLYLALDSLDFSVPDSTPPTVSAITMSGATGAGGAYKIGDTVSVSWNNTAAGDNNSDAISRVTVDFSRFGGGSAVTATNSSGIWTATYTIAPGTIDSTNLKVSVSASDYAGNTATTAAGSETLDNLRPAVSSVAVPAAARYGAGQNLDFTVNFSENITVSNTDSSLSLTIGSTPRTAAYCTKTASSITYRYTVQSGDNDGDGITVGTIASNTTVVTDDAGNSANMTLNGVGNAAAVLVDTKNPTVISGSVPANGTYSAGQNLDFTINYDENVSLDTLGGNPFIPLTLETGGAVNASYVSGSGSSALVFRYTVMPGNKDADGVALGSAINMNGGTIKDGAGNEAAPALSGVGSTAAVLVDAENPSVSSVSVPANATYGEGQILNFVVNFNKAVTVNTIGGTPNINLTVASQAVPASYLSGSGTTSIIFSYTIAQDLLDTDGITLGSSISTNGGTIRDAAGNDAVLTLNGAGSTAGILVDSIAPEVTGIVRLNPTQELLNTGSAVYRVTFSEGVTGVDAGDFVLTKTGSADGAVASVSAISGTGADVTVNTVSGTGTLRLDLKNSGTGISDAAGNIISTGFSGGEVYTVDSAAPTAGNGGTITTGAITFNTAELKWTAGTDNQTLPANLKYKIVKSQSNNLNTLENSISNGAVAVDWSTGIISGTAAGLSPGSTYYFNVIVKDEAGNMAAYTSISCTTAAQSANPQSGGNGGSKNGTPTNTPVIIDGQAQNFASASTSTVGNQTVTTITVDDDKLQAKLKESGKHPSIVIPINGSPDVGAGVLSGQTIKTMEKLEAVLEIRTSDTTYTLSAAQIDIDEILRQLGPGADPQDVKINISIARASQNTVKILEDTANRNHYQLLVKPVEFNITCTYGSKTIEITEFNGYVERTVAIPDGIDPGRITTGIVLADDGTFSHVPTAVIKADGRYYARISSLTNSTYSVIYNPMEFKDMKTHWAREAVGSMGSRLVVSGTGNGQYSPDKDITRAEFAAIIVRALGLKEGEGEVKFGDVRNSDWYAGYVDTAVSYGLIMGYSDSTFGSADKITREQAMTMIARAMKLTGLNSPLTEQEINAQLSGYEDGASVSGYAEAGIAACLKTGVAAGRTGSTIVPEGYISRAETAVMLERLLKKSDLI